uniref:SKA complex subunit 1 n=1 Tax=Aotus nancymaae TaxID=37293 RepID=A0A2K5CWM8_AOTNA
MASSDLELLCSHVNEKIGNIKKTLSLRNCGQEPTLKTVLNKIGDEITVANELLNKLELEIQHREQTNNSLKELCESLEDYKDIEHLKGNIPSHLPQVRVTQRWVKGSHLHPEEPNKAVEPEPIKKLPKEQKTRSVKEMPFTTCDKFNGVLSYMKSRLTYAVISKYKILYQRKKSMNSVERYQRSLFIMETDIKEFTNLKVDRKFLVILSILLHCQRLSEVRGGGLTPYVIT